VGSGPAADGPPLIVVGRPPRLWRRWRAMPGTVPEAWSDRRTGSLARPPLRWWSRGSRRADEVTQEEGNLNSEIGPYDGPDGLDREFDIAVLEVP